ncbi:MAG: hypothetical protein WCK55_18830 [Verrucomicrobiota bacterium]
MKKAIALSFFIVVFSPVADAAVVNWAANALTPSQLQLADGTPIPQFTGLLEIGYFSSLSEATIKTDFAGGNTSAIIGDFTVFASHPGNGTSGGANVGSGYWTYADTNTTSSFFGKQIYILALDTGAGSTTPGVNQMGIFTGIHSGSFGGNWLFPVDGGTPGVTSIDLADADTSAGVIVGSASGSPILSTYKLATIPVPEPSALMFVAMAALTTAAVRKRKSG